MQPRLKSTADLLNLPINELDADTNLRSASWPRHYGASHQQSVELRITVSLKIVKGLLLISPIDSDYSETEELSIKKEGTGDNTSKNLQKLEVKSREKWFLSHFANSSTPLKPVKSCCHCAALLVSSLLCLNLAVILDYAPVSCGDWSWKKQTCHELTYSEAGRAELGDRHLFNQMNVCIYLYHMYSNSYIYIYILDNAL